MPTRREIIEAFIPNSPHAAALGIRLASIGSDEAVLELPGRGDEVPENPAGATIALSVNFASAARGVDLRAESKVVRRGGRLSFCEISVRDPEGELVAHGIATYRFG